MNRKQRRHPQADPVVAMRRDSYKPQITIAYISPDTLSYQFNACLVNLLFYDFGHGQYARNAKSGHCGPRVAHGRNEIVRQFLEDEGSDWLWFVDSDMTFPADLFESIAPLLAQPEKIGFVGGIGYILDPQGVLPNIYRMGDDEQLHTIHDYERGKLIVVDGVGAACMFIHRTALEKVQAEFGDRSHVWFQESEHKGLPVGEDLTFCMRLAATGTHVYVHTGIPMGHVKTTVVDESTYDAFMASQEVA